MFYFTKNFNAASFSLLPANMASLIFPVPTIIFSEASVHIIAKMVTAYSPGTARFESATNMATGGAGCLYVKVCICVDDFAFTCLYCFSKVYLSQRMGFI
jgi:hypothetical protein